ncbi:MAG: hypothetical protein IPK87_00135 [Planctomycetes bacterium]|nr:hypothetical protein [Planctomycetota bacterium]
MKYEPQPGWWLWWDTGPKRFFRNDGTRYRHRIDYWAIILHDVFRDLPGILSSDRAVRLKARKLLWRRLRHGYYDRHYDKHIPAPPPRWDDQGKRMAEPEFIPTCLARCKDGHRCRAKAVTNKFTGKQSNRCKWHGGHATGPRTTDGKVRALVALARARQARWNRGAA